MTGGKSKTLRLLISITILVIATMLFSCGLLGPDHDSGRGTCPDATPDFIHLFEKTAFRSELQKNCKGCHSSNSALAPSFFADPDAGVAYAPAKLFVDFTNPAKSFFVQRMQQGHNCADQCAQWEKIFKEQIEQWANAELAVTPQNCTPQSFENGAQKITVRTPEQVVPTSLEMGLPTKITYDLAQAQPALPLALFRVSVVRFTETTQSDSGSYEIKEPILAMAPRNENPRTNIAISDLILIFNGREDILYRSWRAIRYVFKPRSFVIGTILPFYAATDLVQLVGWHGPLSDSLSFQFTIELTHEKQTPTPYSCKAESNFLSNVLPIFTDKLRKPSGSSTPVKCTQCHSVRGAGYAAFPMVGAANSCEEFKKRSNLTSPLASLFISYPSGEAHDGGRFTFLKIEKDKITEWLELER